MGALHITKENFETEVLTAKKTVLIDFGAPWCGPCKMLGPVIEEVVGEAIDRAKVCKINVDEQPELAECFGVASIPTLVVMKDGKVANAAVGFKPKASVLALIA